MTVLAYRRSADAICDELGAVATIMLLASCQTYDDREWADYSLGLDHVLNK